jgi:glutathione-specific gamma-glutamylcyclotransferase
MPGETPEFALADPMPPEIKVLRDSAEPVWTFAYGSLMWDPDFPPDFPRAETEPALLRGHHRSFCLYPYNYRGTRARPGLTLGLDRGGPVAGSRFACRRDARRAVRSPVVREMTAPRVWGY